MTEWFIERADRILLLFDAHKLDISDEFKRVIQLLRGHDDKVRLVLNKADATEPQELMRVYGARAARACARYASGCVRGALVSRCPAPTEAEAARRRPAQRQMCIRDSL
mgnify:CR=1 FL=1